MRYPPRWLALALILIVLRTTLLVLSVSNMHGLQADEAVYDRLARSVLAGNGYSMQGEPSIFRPPGWPLSLAAIYASLGDDRRVVVALQGLFDAGTALICGWLAGGIFGARAAGALAFLIVLLWPPFFRESRFMQTDPLYCFLVTATLAGFARLVRVPDWRPALVTGVCAGLATLVRPTGFVYLGGLLLGWFVWRPTGVWRHIRLLPVLGLGVALVLAPWTIRNYRVFHAFIPLSVGTGQQFFGGGLLETDGRWDLERWGALGAAVIERERSRVGRSLSPIEEDRALLRAGIDNWRRSPGASAVLWLKRIWRMCFLPVTGQERPLLRIGFLMTLVVLYALALPRAVEGLRATNSSLAVAGMMGIALVFGVMVHSVLFTNSRYFEPMRPMVIVLAAGTLARWRASSPDRYSPISTASTSA